MRSRAKAHIRDDDAYQSSRNRSSFAGCVGQIVDQKNCHYSCCRVGMNDDATKVAMLNYYHQVALDRSAPMAILEYQSIAIDPGLL